MFDEKSAELVCDIADIFQSMDHTFGARAFVAAYVAGTDLPLKTEKDWMIAVNLAKNYVTQLASVEQANGKAH
jgi:hypothetical protein